MARHLVAAKRVDFIFYFPQISPRKNLYVGTVVLYRDVRKRFLNNWISVHSLDLTTYMVSNDEMIETSRKGSSGLLSNHSL